MIIAMEPECPEGLDENPPPHLADERHEECEVCHKWFPERFISYEERFACPPCIASRRDRRMRIENQEMRKRS